LFTQFITKLFNFAVSQAFHHVALRFSFFDLISFWFPIRTYDIFFWPQEHSGAGELNEVGSDPPLPSCKRRRMYLYMAALYVSISSSSTRATSFPNGARK
jgi:hypothetical protein